MNFQCTAAVTNTMVPSDAGSMKSCRVVIVSFLFNWPTTGGGNIHTYELAQFLGRAGYDVHHLYVRFPAWGIGKVDASLPYVSLALEFSEDQWSRGGIQERVREAVRALAPDYVILTDSWNFKPLLAEAVREFPYILRLQANECLCPLNNVRLLLGSDGRATQCPRHQLARPDACRQCLREHGRLSGSLHQAERELSGVGTDEYQRTLLRAFAEAEAVFVVNPMTGALVEPYAERVVVSPAGMDPARCARRPIDREHSQCAALVGDRRSARRRFQLRTGRAAGPRSPSLLHPPRYRPA